MTSLGATYKGYQMASRLECRWAMFWDAVGCSWEYEPMAFQLKTVRYLPDFYLPEQQCWVEIKGTLYNDRKTLRILAQCGELAEYTKRPVILCFSDPYNPRCAVFSRSRMYTDSIWTTCPTCGELALKVRSDGFSYTWCSRKHEAEPLSFASLRIARRRLSTAALAARQYRFGVPARRAS